QTDTVPAGELRGAASWESPCPLLASDGEQPVLSRRSRLTTVESTRPAAAPLRDERDRRGLQHFELALDAVATGRRAGTAAAAPEAVAAHAHRERPLERLDRRVARVRHRGVDAAHPRLARAPALPAADGLVIDPTLAADEDVVHRPL